MDRLIDRQKDIYIYIYIYIYIDIYFDIQIDINRQITCCDIPEPGVVVDDVVPVLPETSGTGKDPLHQRDRERDEFNLSSSVEETSSQQQPSLLSS